MARRSHERSLLLHRGAFRNEGSASKGRTAGSQVGISCARSDNGGLRGPTRTSNPETDTKTAAPRLECAQRIARLTSGLASAARFRFTSERLTGGCEPVVIYSGGANAIRT